MSAADKHGSERFGHRDAPSLTETRSKLRIKASDCSFVTNVVAVFWA